ncbi:MAG TPA: TetR family transcriptional regulator [Micromonosporaceae bacterium]|nr:TetR family transcriptional regulator [Micromonosporaceae bacterium]
MSSKRYSSTLRAEQAAQTRQRVLSAAAERFAEDGFARTTLAKLAEAAGVSVETVQAQGSKRSLLTGAVHQLSFGGPQETFFSAPEARATVEAATPVEFCRHGADLVAGFNAQTFRLWRAFSSAAADDPAVDQDLTELSGFIRGQCRQIVAMLAERGWLRDDVATDELGDSLWILVGSENYDKATVRLGWSHERYLAWLTRSLDDLLFRA